MNNGNPTLNRLIRQTIYDLKHRFGGEATVYKVVNSTTDYKTGTKSIDTTSRLVRKAIILPNQLTRELFQGVSYLSASKSFASLGGQGWDEATRSFIFDGRDLRGYSFDIEDWIVYRGKRYDIETIEELEYDNGWLVIGKEIKGQTSGGSITLDVDQTLGLNQSEEDELETP